MRPPKFESVQRKDGLQEERVIEKGMEESPLRRAIGMPAFENDAERDAWLEKIGSRLKEKIKDTLSEMLEGYKGERSRLEDEARTYLAFWLGIPEKEFQVEADEKGEKLKVDIHSSKYGNMEFEL